MSDTEQAKALRKAINEAIKALSRKIPQTSDELLQAEIAEQIGSLMAQRAKLTRMILNTRSAELSSTIDALNDVAEEAKMARSDIAKIENLIRTASKAVDKVTQFIGGLTKVIA